MLSGKEKQTNSYQNVSQNFYRHGGGTLPATWSNSSVRKEDMYRGYAYAAIQRRANRVASIARMGVITTANTELTQKVAKTKSTLEHPYLTKIKDSVDFSEKKFWRDISVYLDLAGVYYLGVVREYIPETTILSPVKKFVMLNPFEITRIEKEGKVVAYQENKPDGRTRVWQPHQIIEMRELNPFDQEKAWSLSEASENAVYTLQQSGDYTRKSIAGNINAPGIISTSEQMSDELFQNFMTRVKSNLSGEPLFGNGTGAIDWKSMSVDLDSSALSDINELNRNELFAVSGTSKTVLGIEESGTTRETARVQADNFIADSVQPRIEDIIDHLNMDYKKSYPEDFKKTDFQIKIGNVLSRDYDNELSSVQLKIAQLDLIQKVVDQGYTQESAAAFAMNEAEISDLELRDSVKMQRAISEKELGDKLKDYIETKKKPEEPKEEGDQDQEDTSQNGLDPLELDQELEIHPDLETHVESKLTEEGIEIEDILLTKTIENTKNPDDIVDTYSNDISDLDTQQLKTEFNSSLKAFKTLHTAILNTLTSELTKNGFTDEFSVDDVKPEDKEKWTSKILSILSEYWYLIVPIYAKAVMAQRNETFDEKTLFELSETIKQKIEGNAELIADSHLNTVLKDINQLSNKTFTKLAEKQAVQLVKKQLKDNPDKLKTYLTPKATNKEILKAIQDTDLLETNKKIYQEARKLALDGKNRLQIAKEIKQEFKDVSAKRAETLARNETARAFTFSQYQADTQFLNQTGLFNKAYKELYSRSGHPCEFCKEIISHGPIPFSQNFLNKGDQIQIVDGDKVRNFVADFEDIEAGNIHTNCNCGYRLILNNNQVEDVVKENSNMEKLYNDLAISHEHCECCNAGNPYHDEKGRFAPKGAKGSGVKAKDPVSEADAKLEANLADTAKELTGDVKDLFKYREDMKDSNFSKHIEAKKNFESQRDKVNKAYTEAYLNHGTKADLAKVDKALYEWSEGDLRNPKTGEYMNEPALSKHKNDIEFKIHTKLTQQALKQAGIKEITLYRGQDKSFKNPKGLTSFTDSKARAKIFNSNVIEMKIPVEKIVNHYALHDKSKYKKEREVIVDL